MNVANVYLDGWRLAVVGDAGRKYVPVVEWRAGNLSVTKLPKEATRTFLPAGGRRAPSLARVARRLLAIGRKFGMTQGARELLQQAAGGAS